MVLQYRFLLIVVFFVVATAPHPAATASLAKLDEVKRGEVSRLSVAGLDFPLGSNLFVTGLRDSANKLRLLVWHVNSAGKAEVRGVHVTEGTIKEVAVAGLPGLRFVTALRDSADALRLIAWEVSADGRMIQRLRTTTGPKISHVTAASHSSSSPGEAKVFIAARTLNGRLITSVFEISADGSVINMGEAQFGDIDASLPGVGPLGDIVSVADGISHATAMRDGGGRLRLIHFWLPLFRGGKSTGGEVSDVSIGGYGSGVQGEWFTFSIPPGGSGVRRGAGCLDRLIVPYGAGKIIGWKLESTALSADFERTREKQLTGTDALARKGDVLHLPSSNLLVTGHLGFSTWCKLLKRDQGKPRLHLSIWDTRVESDSFGKVAEAHLSGDYTELDLATIADRGDEARFVVALRGSRGELKVSVWGTTR